MKKTLILLLAFNVWGCHKIDQTKIKLIKYADGSFCSIPYILKNGDTSIEGKVRCYYANNKIEDIVNFWENKENGWTEHYDSLGHLLNKTFFLNGLKQDSSYKYNNEHLEAVSLYDHGHMILNIWFYFNNKIELYNLFAPNDSLQYAIQYDATGKKVHESGRVIYIIKDSSIFNKKIYTDDLIKFQLFSTVIPNYTTKVKVVKIEDNKNESEVLQMINYTSNYTTYFAKPGFYKMAFVGELFDENQMKVAVDSILVDISIQNKN